MTPRLFWTAASLQARTLMSYRAAFWATAGAAFAVEITVAYFLWRAVFDAAVFEAGQAERIGGFTFRGMMLYYVCARLASKLVYGRERDLNISSDIYEGHLTRYLLYPVRYGVFKYAEHLGAMLPALVQATLFGLVAVVVVPLPSEIAIRPATVAAACVSILSANLLVYVLRFAIQLVAFWADNVWSLNVMARFLMEFFGGLLLPLSLFPERVQTILEATPFPYLFYYPVMVLLGRVEVERWLLGLGITLGWTLALGAVARWIWRRGNRTYTGVGI